MQTLKVQVWCLWTNAYSGHHHEHGRECSQIPNPLYLPLSRPCPSPVTLTGQPSHSASSAECLPWRPPPCDFCTCFFELASLRCDRHVSWVTRLLLSLQVSAPSCSWAAICSPADPFTCLRPFVLLQFLAVVSRAATSTDYVHSPFDFPWINTWGWVCGWYDM